MAYGTKARHQETQSKNDTDRSTQKSSRFLKQNQEIYLNYNEIMIIKLSKRHVYDACTVWNIYHVNLLKIELLSNGQASRSNGKIMLPSLRHGDFLKIHTS